MSKFYAIKKGRKTGIFTDWLEVEPLILRFKGAIYKAFSTKEQAEAYLENSNIDSPMNLFHKQVHQVFILGGYEPDDKSIFYGTLIINSNQEVVFTFSNVLTEQATTTPFLGEIFAIKEAMKWFDKNGVKESIIHYSYEGIKQWATGGWEAKVDVAIDYLNFMKSNLNTKIEWVHQDSDITLKWQSQLKDEVTDKLYEINQKKHQIKREADIKTLTDLGLFSEQRERNDCLKKVIFITGKAGTGKSHFIQSLMTKLNEVVVIAPTGLAALQVKGQTIHSFFNLPIHYIDQADLNRAWIFSHQLTHLFHLQILIIDEVSMVRVDLLDNIDRILRLAKNRNLPFGGIYVILVGDLFQLPPIIQNEVIENNLIDETSQNLEIELNIPPNLKDLKNQPDGIDNLHEWILNIYKGIHFFNAPVFKESKLFVVELMKIYRQDDPSFIETLGHIRDGNFTSRDLNLFLPCIKRTMKGIIVSTTRRSVGQLNQTFFDKLPQNIHEIKGKVTYLKDDKALIDLPNEEILQLKVGTQVIMIANVMVKGSFGKKWIINNGTIGLISKIERNEPTIHQAQTLKNLDQMPTYTSKVFVRLPDENKNMVETEIPIHTWFFHKYIYNKQDNKLDHVVYASYSQLPLIPAWAITIHKSQGLSFDQITINLDDSPFSTGQLYVALSRARKIDGIALSRPLFSSDVKVDQEVIQFFKQAEDDGRLKKIESFSL